MRRESVNQRARCFWKPEAGTGSRKREGPPAPGHPRDAGASAQRGACWASRLRTVRGPVSRRGHRERAV